MTGLLGWGGAAEALDDCDLLFMLGTDFPYHPFLPVQRRRSSRSTTRPRTSAGAPTSTLGLVGDVGETLRALLPELEQRTDSSFLDKIMQSTTRTTVKRLQTYVEHQGEGEGLRPEMVATALSDLADDDASSRSTPACATCGARATCT